MPKPPRDDAIEGVRGLAALGVLVAHVGGEVARESPLVGALLWPVEATAAVMIFFVLSGYVVGLTTSRAAPGARCVRAFAWRRVVRLWPINAAGVLLGCAVAHEVEIVTVLGNLFGLQNYNDYFGLRVPVLPTNANLWSLNYEVVYYALFALLWWGGARVLPTMGVALGLGVAMWFGPASGVFVACYAFGLLFWLGGLAIAWHGTRAAGERVNWPAWVLLALVTWKLNPLREAMFALGWPKPYFSGPIVRLYYLDFLPVSLVLVGLFSRSTFPALRWLKLAALAVPVVGLVRQLAWPAGGQSAQLAPCVVALVLAGALWRWTPSLQVVRVFGPLGLVSYALYATSRPIQEYLFRHRDVFGDGLSGAVLAATLTITLGVGLAWYLERRVQPALTRRLVARRPAPDA